MPWQKVHKVSVAIETASIAYDPEDATVNQNWTVLEAVSKDLNIGVTGQLRFKVSEKNLPNALHFRGQTPGRSYHRVFCLHPAGADRELSGTRRSGHFDGEIDESILDGDSPQKLEGISINVCGKISTNSTSR